LPSKLDAFLQFAEADTVKAGVRLEMREGGKWQPVNSGAVSSSLKWPLKAGSEYRVALFGGGDSTLKELSKVDSCLVLLLGLAPNGLFRQHSHVNL
jgi:hypothetical protein